MIIEDDSIVALHIKETVESRGHHIIGVAKRAKDALDIAQKEKPDLVISDINIEGEIDGIDCCKRLQKAHSCLVILISAYNDMATLKSASSLDFLGYLIKPFREDELLTLLDLVVLRDEEEVVLIREKIDEVYSYCSRQYTLYKHEEVIELTQKENSFMEALIKANGAIVPYDHLAYLIWDNEVVSDEARRQLVHRLKQKLPNFPFKLVKGIGYKLNV